MKTRALAAVALLFLASPALLPADATNPIQPGDQINGVCTLAFIFDGVGPRAGKVYGLTAAHCVNRVGQSVSTAGHANFGTVAYHGNPNSNPWDFALIEIKSAHHSNVVASMRGHPEYPTGYTTWTETAVGDPLQFSGFGFAFSFTGPTREQRVGVLTRDNANTFHLAGPMDFGDSGGPIAHMPTGKALGIESRVGAPWGTDTGPTIEGILAKADSVGFPIQLRTV